MKLSNHINHTSRQNETYHPNKYSEPQSVRYSDIGKREIITSVALFALIISATLFIGACSPEDPLSESAAGSDDTDSGTGSTESGESDGTGSANDSTDDSDFATDSGPTPVAEVNTASGIEALPDCAVARNGDCLKPLTRTAQDVCARFKTVLSPSLFEDIWTPGENACDPGMLKMAVLTDALDRLNFYRWLLDIPQLMADPDEDIWRQVGLCAVVTASNASPDPHHPPETATCYSDDAYAATSTSSLDFSAYAPAVAIDRFIFDMGASNYGRLGHRRSLLSYFFDRVAVGFTRINVNTADVGGSTCVRMDMATYEESELLTERLSAYPPPGFMPCELILQQLKGTAEQPLQWHLNIQNVSFNSAATQVYKVVADGYLPLTAETGLLEHRPLDGDGIWIQPATEPGAGEYLVDVSGTSAGDLGYRVILTDCGTAVPEDCSLVTQDCGADWLGCYQNADGDSYCMHAGFQEKGIPCSASRWCKPGLICIDNISETAAVCSPYCDSTDSASAQSCDTICKGPVTRVGDATVCKLE